MIAGKRLSLASFFKIQGNLNKLNHNASFSIMKNRGTNKKRAVKKNVSNSLSLLWILPIALFFGCDHKEKFKEGTKEVSGAYYDWTMSMKPETPWNHEYDQTLVMKIFLCSRTGEGEGDRVNLKFDDALEVIKKADHLTLGIPKIVYLVGWQYNGHDSKYPSWSEVNKSLKREEDSSALESLKWLMKEAKKYNTTISLHINMINAFKDLPLWDTYLENDIIAKDEQGNPIKGEPFMGMDSYQISYTQEWKLGYAQQRIYGLVKMLPELKDAGTGHIDAFHSIRPKAVRDDGSPRKNEPFSRIFHRGRDCHTTKNIQVLDGACYRCHLGRRNVLAPGRSFQRVTTYGMALSTKEFCR